MLEIAEIDVKSHSYLCLRAEIPRAPPPLPMFGEGGGIMCGDPNIDASDGIGASSAIVSYMGDFDDVLNAQIKASTTKEKPLCLDTRKVFKVVLGSRLGSRFDLFAECSHPFFGSLENIFSMR